MSAIPDYQDAGHRPHARHDGEYPENPIVEAPYHLQVHLDTWGPETDLFPSLYDALQANWGDSPSDTICNVTKAKGRGEQTWADVTGWNKLTPTQQAYIESCFAGKTLPQVLERISFAFRIDGCSRACTHQLVRTRIGAAMMQHGGRDNDWRHRPWIMPETIRRACEAHEAGSAMHGAPDLPSNTALRHPITDWEPINRLLGADQYTKFGHMGLREVIVDYLQNGRNLYAALVDAGIPWEDARRLLWMGTATYIHIDYNYLALQGVMARRLEHVMDWEINCVAQLMKREVIQWCPPLFGKYLQSASDRMGRAAFAGLQSWPPDGKYPNPYERCECGHAKDNHRVLTGHPGVPMVCEVCDRDHTQTMVCSRYRPEDALAREHRPEQNPFWVLHPDSMAGGPIQWIPTNGTYPHDEVK